SRQTLEDLNVDMKRLQEGVAEMNKHRAALLALEPELQTAITREKKHNQATGPQLLELDKQKPAARSLLMVASTSLTCAITACVFRLSACFCLSSSRSWGPVAWLCFFSRVMAV